MNPSVHSLAETNPELAGLVSRIHPTLDVLNFFDIYTRRDPNTGILRLYTDQPVAPDTDIDRRLTQEVAARYLPSLCAIGEMGVHQEVVIDRTSRAAGAVDVDIDPLNAVGVSRQELDTFRVALEAIAEV